MHDKELKVVNSDSPHYKKILQSRADMSDFCIVLAYICHKAKRVSSSTSTAETLVANLGRELAQLVALRLTEVMGHGMCTPYGIATPLKSLIDVQENCTWIIPVDHVTDCRDVFELVVGAKGVPQDRYQRLYVMSLREDRVKGGIRRFFWIPTTAMLADSLTKSMISSIMMDLLQWGYWRFDNANQDPLCGLPLNRIKSPEEHTLKNIGQVPVRPEWVSPSCAHTAVRFVSFNKPMRVLSGFLAMYSFDFDELDNQLDNPDSTTNVVES